MSVIMNMRMPVRTMSMVAADMHGLSLSKFDINLTYINIADAEACFKLPRGIRRGHFLEFF